MTVAANNCVAPPFGGRERSIRRLRVDRREDQRGGRTVLHEPVEEPIGGGVGVTGGDVAALLGKGEAVQPVEEDLARGSEHPVLREVDVGVDESGERERVPVVGSRSRVHPRRTSATRRACGFRPKVITRSSPK